MRGRIDLVPTVMATLLTVVAFSVAGPAQARVQARVQHTTPRGHDTPRGSIGIRLLDAAVSRSDNPRARLYIEDHVTPGTTLVRHVLVTNNTGRAQDVSLYAGPATIDRGSFIGDPAGARSELTAWTRLSQSRVRLSQGSSRRVRVQIAVPGYASRSERYGVLWASISSGAGAGTLTMVNRVGVRIYLDVGAGGEDPSRFTVSRLVARRMPSGEPMVQAAVRDTGGRALDLSGTLMLTQGPGGLRAGPFRVRTPTTLAPGQQDWVWIALDRRVPAGPWRARIDLHSGLVRAAATGRITFPAAGGTTHVTLTPVAESRRPDRRFAIMIGGAGIAAGVAACLVVGTRRRRRAQEDTRGAP